MEAVTLQKPYFYCVCRLVACEGSYCVNLLPRNKSQLTRLKVAAVVEDEEKGPKARKRSEAEENGKVKERQRNLKSRASRLLNALPQSVPGDTIHHCWTEHVVITFLVNWQNM